MVLASANTIGGIFHEQLNEADRRDSSCVTDAVEVDLDDVSRQRV